MCVNDSGVLIAHIYHHPPAFPGLTHANKRTCAPLKHGGAQTLVSETAGFVYFASAGKIGASFFRIEPSVLEWSQ
jgi:hypothetical protein